MYCQQDVVYRYDGSWQGFLCCVFYSVYHKQLPFAVLAYNEPSLTLFPDVFIDTDPDKANRVQNSFRQKLGPGAKTLVSNAFLNGAAGKELRLLRFLIFGYKTGPAAMAMLGHPDVAPVVDLEKQVKNEAHLLTGFVRFEDYGSFLGAVIEPKHYVLPLLRAHFCQRFCEEDFIIYDGTHSAALLYQQHKASYVQLASAPVFPQISPNEAHFQALWKQFYRTIAIKARENPTLRQGQCPKRYWSNMTELKQEP